MLEQLRRRVLREVQEGRRREGTSAWWRRWQQERPARSSRSRDDLGGHREREGARDSCGDKSSAKGKVKVKVSVGGDGRVSGVTVETSPDAALGACVAGGGAEGVVRQDAERRLVQLPVRVLARTNHRQSAPLEGAFFVSAVPLAGWLPALPPISAMRRQSQLRASPDRTDPRSDSRASIGARGMDRAIAVRHAEATCHGAHQSPSVPRGLCQRRGSEPRTMTASTA